VQEAFSQVHVVFALFESRLLTEIGRVTLTNLVQEAACSHGLAFWHTFQIDPFLDSLEFLQLIDEVWLLLLIDTKLVLVFRWKFHFLAFSFLLGDLAAKFKHVLLVFWHL